MTNVTSKIVYPYAPMDFQAIIKEYYKQLFNLDKIDHFFRKYKPQLTEYKTDDVTIITKEIKFIIKASLKKEMSTFRVS